MSNLMLKLLVRRTIIYYKCQPSPVKIMKIRCNDVDCTSDLARHKAKLGSQSIAYGCCHTPGVAGHHLEELGIDPALEPRADSQWVVAGRIDPLVDNQEQDHHHQWVGLQQERRQLERALRLLCVHSLPPSCEPSTLFEFP